MLDRLADVSLCRANLEPLREIAEECEALQDTLSRFDIARNPWFAALMEKATRRAEACRAAIVEIEHLRERAAGAAS